MILTLTGIKKRAKNNKSFARIISDREINLSLVLSHTL